MYVSAFLTKIDWVQYAVSRRKSTRVKNVQHRKRSDNSESNLSFARTQHHACISKFWKRSIKSCNSNLYRTTFVMLEYIANFYILHIVVTWYQNNRRDEIINETNKKYTIYDNKLSVCCVTVWMLNVPIPRYYTVIKIRINNEVFLRSNVKTFGYFQALW